LSALQADGIMKKFLVFLCAAVTALSSLAFSACGFSACSNSDYGRQLRAIKRIAADESYRLCTYEYINTLKGGECKYAGYYPGDGTLIKLYKR